MSYPCGIIKDLIPLYIDGVCGGESSRAVEMHIKECEKCRRYCEIMKETNGFEKQQNITSEDMKMADSLKKVKLKINKKIRNIIIGSGAAMLAFAVGFQILFNAPIKKISKNDVAVSAEVYPTDELPYNLKSDDDSVEISFGENDGSNLRRIEIPSHSDTEISVPEDVIEKNEYISVISVTSEYFLREIKQVTKGDTIYISAFKTTLLNNKGDDYQKTMTSIEFAEINKIVYIEDNGTETILWER